MARFTISKKQRQRLQNRQALAEKAGDIKTIRKIAAILLFFEQDNCLYNISTIIGKSEKCILNWVKSFMVKGLNSLKLKWSRGRPSKLDRDKLAKLKIMITEGPQSFGYPEGCWNCAMIVDLILKTWEITYSAKYLPQLLKRLGLSYQKAKFQAAKADPVERYIWLSKTWLSILVTSKKNNAKIFFQDESSFAL